MKARAQIWSATRVIAIGITSILLLNACEDNFKPLKENSRYYFSIYGALNASADTQWVRVMPVRDSILTSDEPLGAEVTLTKKSDGAVHILQDSLFKLRDNYYAWNYWTDANIEPGEEYYFKATNKDGASTTAEIAVPIDFPTPIVDYSDEQTLARVYVEDVERVAVADILYYFKVVERGVVKPEMFSEPYSIKGDMREEENGRKIIYAYPKEGFGEINEKYVIDDLNVKHIKQEVMVVSGGPNWPESGELSEDERFLPGAVSNVDHGLGLLVGVVSKRVPLKSCHDNQGDLIACPLVNPGSVRIVE